MDIKEFIKHNALWIDDEVEPVINMPHAKSVEEAKKFLDKEVPMIIFLDYQIIGGTGRDVLDYIKEKEYKLQLIAPISTHGGYNRELIQYAKDIGLEIKWFYFNKYRSSFSDKSEHIDTCMQYVNNALKELFEGEELPYKHYKCMWE